MSVVSRAYIESARAIVIEHAHAIIVFAVALLTRLAVVAWAFSAIGPAADGTYYHRLALRIADGDGYTWLWPDGVVTYAAHYPVGYPALMAAVYAVFGAKPGVAMLMNALFGAFAASAVHSLALRAAPAKLALLAALAFALHPALVPYTAALMTEGVTTSLLVIAAAIAARARHSTDAESVDSKRRFLPFLWIALAGIVMGVCTLVRPQSLALAPVLGALALPRTATVWRRAAAGALAFAVSVAVCAPWTVRNCRRMERCALVSVNGGWNLAIGAQTTTGGWHEIKVPEACKTVFQEAAKDECFGREAAKEIGADPIGWLIRIPAKLRATFDYFGAAPWYLHESNRERFPYESKVALGAVETLVSRLLLAAALFTLIRMEGGGAVKKGVRRALGVVGLVSCVLVPGTIGYLALAIGIGLLGFRALARAPLIVPLTSAVILATAATHAVFFGSGRYGLVVIPFVTALAFASPAGRRSRA